jgi:hypothetical protein
MVDHFVDLQTYTNRTIEVRLLCSEAARGIFDAMRSDKSKADGLAIKMKRKR